MHGPINVKYPNNTSKWLMGFNSAFKGLIYIILEAADVLNESQQTTNFFLDLLKLLL
jgi:hypothetical protein